MSDEPKISPDLQELFAHKLLIPAIPIMDIDDKGKWTVVHWCQCLPYCPGAKKDQ